MAKPDIIITADHTDEFKQEFKEAVDRALEAIGMHIEGEAKEELNNTPKRIDTGLLRNSITYAISGEAPAIRSYHASQGSKRDSSGRRRGSGSESAGSVGFGTYSGTAPQDPDDQRAVYVGSNVEYASYIHEGFTMANGRKIAPNRYLKNAVDKNRDQIGNLLQREMDKIKD